ncbi:MAG: hypothetical protein AB7G40_07880 [Hyphomonadaceae bacterium]
MLDVALFVGNGKSVVRFDKQLNNVFAVHGCQTNAAIRAGKGFNLAEALKPHGRYDSTRCIDAFSINRPALAKVPASRKLREVLELNLGARLEVCFPKSAVVRHPGTYPNLS